MGGINLSLFIEKDIVLIVTFICSLFLYINMRASKIAKKHLIIVICLIIGIATLFQTFGGYNLFILKIAYIMVMCITLSLIDRKRFYFSLSVAIISVAISYSLEYIGVFIVSFAFFFGYTGGNLITTFVSCAIQVVLCYCISKIRRIKKAFLFLEREENFGLGLLISSYSLLFCLLITDYEHIKSYVGMILFFGAPLVLVGLILWIRSIVKRYYKNKLQDRANEYTKQEIEDKDKRIERLEAEVTALAKQVHRDNHLMTSVDRSVQELAACDSAEQREQIIGEIHTLYLERNDSIAKEQQKNKILPSTGFALIDSSLSELYVKAAARGISFDLTVSEEPYYLVNNIISQTDLQTLLCDHIKDAIIAVESAGIADGRILVTIEKKDSIFEIAIRDNGVDFDVDTLARIGKEQVTTHADDGGSGIGFMTTFETLHKTKGSLIITEYEQKTPFSKSVAFVFDGLNRFVISTYRKEELEKAIERDDVRIIVQ